MDIYWLEQTTADVPADNDWLSSAEQVRLRQFRVAKRQADWRLGRWTAKCAVSAYLGLWGSAPPRRTIEILPATTGAPQVMVRNARAGLHISLTHRDGTAACVVAPAGVVGCDLEAIESRSAAFLADYFATEEQGMFEVESPLDRDAIATLLWSAKESALKALSTGLRLDTRSVVVNRRGAGKAGQAGAQGSWSSAAENGWSPLEVRHSDDQVFYGWWQRSGGFIRTVVADPPPLRPRTLCVTLAAA